MAIEWLLGAAATRRLALPYLDSPIGIALGGSGFVWVATVAWLASRRPDGGGQLAALWRSREAEGSPRLSLVTLCLELAGVVAFIGFSLLTVRSRLWAFGHEGEFATPYTMPAVGCLALAALLWGASWVAEGLSLTRDRPWRDG